jgi:hypothetical protein
MRATIQATAVSASEDDGILSLAFASSDSGEGPYVIVQRSEEASEQDAALGMDGVYLEYESQSRSTYGHVKLVKLAPGRFNIYLEGEGIESMQGVSEIAVTFSVSASRFATVAELAQRIFHDIPYTCDTA